MLTVDLLKQRYDITTHLSKDKKGDLFVEFKGSDSFNYWYNSNKWIECIDNVEEAATELLDVLVNIEKLEIFPERVESIRNEALILIHRWYYTTPMLDFNTFLKQQEKQWLETRPWIGSTIMDPDLNDHSIISVDPDSGIVKLLVTYSGTPYDHAIPYLVRHGGVFLELVDVEVYNSRPNTIIVMRFDNNALYDTFKTMGFNPNPMLTHSN